MSRKIYLLSPLSQEATGKCTVPQGGTKTRQGVRDSKGLTQRSQENYQDHDGEGKSQNNSCTVGLVSDC